MRCATPAGSVGMLAARAGFPSGAGTRQERQFLAVGWPAKSSGAGDLAFATALLSGRGFRKSSAKSVLQLCFGNAGPEFCRSDEYGWRGKERHRGLAIPVCDGEG